MNYSQYIIFAKCNNNFILIILLIILFYVNLIIYNFYNLNWKKRLRRYQVIHSFILSTNKLFKIFPISDIMVSKNFIYTLIYD